MLICEECGEKYSSDSKYLLRIEVAGGVKFICTTCARVDYIQLKKIVANIWENRDNEQWCKEQISVLTKKQIFEMLDYFLGKYSKKEVHIFINKMC